MTEAPVATAGLLLSTDQLLCRAIETVLLEADSFPIWSQVLSTGGSGKLQLSSITFKQYHQLFRLILHSKRKDLHRKAKLVGGNLFISSQSTNIKG